MEVENDRLASFTCVKRQRGVTEQDDGARDDCISDKEDAPQPLLRSASGGREGQGWWFDPQLLLATCECPQAKH